jgi:diguanylate cyclase
LIMSSQSTIRTALHLLTQRGLAPTPENFTAVYHEVLGDSAPAANRPYQEMTLEEKFDNDFELIKLVRSLIDTVIASADGLAQDLGQSNVDIKNSITAIEKTAEEQEILNLLSIISNTATAMVHSAEDTRAELINTRQSLAEVRAELEVAKQHLMLDTLTGARSRFGMEISLTQELSRARRANKKLVLAMIDLDHFKQVNDAYGHDAGDQVLLFFAQLARSVLRESDLMFRYGGEEFLALLPDTDIKGAEFLFDRLRQMQAKSPLHYQRHAINVTFSAGITDLRDSDDVQSIIQRADEALYQAKQEGRDRAVIL